MPDGLGASGRQLTPLPVGIDVTGRAWPLEWAVVALPSAAGGWHGVLQWMSTYARWAAAGLAGAALSRNLYAGRPVDIDEDVDHLIDPNPPAPGLAVGAAVLAAMWALHASRRTPAMIGDSGLADGTVVPVSQPSPRGLGAAAALVPYAAALSLVWAMCVSLAAPDPDDPITCIEGLEQLCLDGWQEPSSRRLLPNVALPAAAAILGVLAAAVASASPPGNAVSLLLSSAAMFYFVSEQTRTGCQSAAVLTSAVDFFSFCYFCLAAAATPRVWRAVSWVLMLLAGVTWRLLPAASGCSEPMWYSVPCSLSIVARAVGMACVPDDVLSHVLSFLAAPRLLIYGTHMVSRQWQRCVMMPLERYYSYLVESARALRSARIGTDPPALPPADCPPLVPDGCEVNVALMRCDGCGETQLAEQTATGSTWAHCLVCGRDGSLEFVREVVDAVPG